MSKTYKRGPVTPYLCLCLFKLWQCRIIIIIYITNYFYSCLILTLICFSKYTKYTKKAKKAVSLCSLPVSFKTANIVMRYLRVISSARKAGFERFWTTIITVGDMSQKSLQKQKKTHLNPCCMILSPNENRKSICFSHRRY